VDKSPDNRKGMANATFFSFFDLGIGIGAMVFGQLASFYGYHAIYLTAAGSVMLSMIVYIVLLIRAGNVKQTGQKSQARCLAFLSRSISVQSRSISVQSRSISVQSRSISVQSRSISAIFTSAPSGNYISFGKTIRLYICTVNT